jgi:hypothetical protein
VPVLTAAAALGSARGSRPGRRDQARPNVEALVGDFDRHVRRFEASGVFSGPSVYFHERAIERWRLHATAGSPLLISGSMNQANRTAASQTTLDTLACENRGIAASPWVSSNSGQRR